MSTHSSRGHSDSSAEGDLQAITERLADLEATVEHLQAENERLREQLAEKDAQLDAYEARLDAYEARQHVELRDVEDDADAALEHIWIADQPVGRLLDSSSKRAKTLSSRVDDLETESQTCRDELEEYREQNEKGKADIRRWVADLEDSLGEATSIETEGSATRSASLSTPLERIVALPDTMIDEELTANQERARFIATDVTDYARKVPAGFMIDSSSLRRVLAAKEDGSVHTETVSRVMEFLDRFGEDDVELVKRRGTRRVVFSPRLVERLGRLGRLGAQSQTAETDVAGENHGVVIGST
ncbi:hypothetical protein [Halegenticoccus tardaugens]|uniref:hypothetical protein n=1 Tax=Halegenticoccus tardaugens TaxID=2071624 RepID=UPI00100C2BF5|nr:hypothetical protein [Halegenticoccus tardaugens]